MIPADAASTTITPALEIISRRLFHREEAFHFASPSCRPRLILVFALTTLGLGRYVLAGPLQNDVRHVEIIGPEHHHVGRAIEDRIPQLVQLDVVRLRRALPGGAPGFDG